MKARRSAAVLGAGLMLAASWAAEPGRAAKPAAPPRAAALQAIVTCRAMTDRDARLSCYDAAAAKLDEAESSGQVVVVDREQARRVRREVFGLQLPSLDIFSATGRKGPDPEDVERLQSTVKAASRNPDGRWVLELDTGAVWRQVDDSPMATDPRPGSKIEIRRAALGSFFIRVDGRPGFRAHRDR